MATEQESQRRFLRNIAWTWLGLAVSIASGLLLSPYIIRKLGAEGYGVWQLVYSLLTYFTFVEMGLRSAVVRFTALYRARHSPERLNEVLNTLLAHFASASVLLMFAALLVSRFADRLFKVSLPFQAELPAVTLLAGLNFAVAANISLFSGFVDGFQRFDLGARSRMVTLAARAAGVAGLLALGYGLTAMAAWVLAMNLLLLAIYIWAAHRVFPEIHFSLKHFRLGMWKEAFRYGIHSFLASVAAQTLEQGGPVVIGLQRPATDVGYYSLPVRLLQYLSEAIQRVSSVAIPRAAEHAAQERLDRLTNLGLYANRYCFGLYLSVVLVLAFFGDAWMRLWVGRDFAAQSAHLLPILLAGSAVLAGQANSASILYGLAKHRRYAQGLMLEAALTLTAMSVFVPRHGITAAAIISTTGMVAVRGLYTPWLVCHQLQYPLGKYLGDIYLGPLAAALPAAALGFLLRLWVTPESGYLALIAASAALALVYLAAAFRFCLEPRHRAVLYRALRAS